MIDQSTAPLDRYIRWKDLQHIVPLSRDRVRVLEKEGKFPKRRKLGEHAAAWLESEIREWMSSREAA